MSKWVFCFIYYNCIIILLSVTVSVCHDKGNGFFLTINSPVYVYWKQVNIYLIQYQVVWLLLMATPLLTQLGRMEKMDVNCGYALLMII